MLVPDMYYIKRVGSEEFEEEFFLGFKEGPSHTIKEHAIRAIFDVDQALIYLDKDRLAISLGDLITKCKYDAEEIQVFKITGERIPLEDIIV